VCVMEVNGEMVAVSALKGHMLCVKSQRLEVIVQTSDVIVGMAASGKVITCIGKSGQVFVYKVVEGDDDIGLKLVDNYKPNEKISGGITAIDINSIDFQCIGTETG
jgi:hypothetical protein